MNLSVAFVFNASNYAKENPKMKISITYCVQ